MRVCILAIGTIPGNSWDTPRSLHLVIVLISMAVGVATEC